MNTLYIDQTVLLPSPEANRLTASFMQLWVKFLIIFPGLVEEKEVGRGMEGRKIFSKVIGPPAYNNLWPLDKWRIPLCWAYMVLQYLQA